MGASFHVQEASGEFAAVTTDVRSLAVIHRQTEAWLFGVPSADRIAAQPTRTCKTSTAIACLNRRYLFGALPPLLARGRHFTTDDAHIKLSRLHPTFET